MALSLSHVSALSTASRAQRQGRRQWLRFPRGSGRLPEQSDTTAWVAAAQQRRCSCNAAEDVARLGATSRRELVSAVTLLGLGCVGSGQAAHATYVEEERATSVFDGAQSGVVSLANYVISSEEETAEGVGSGIVWDKLGHVITNYHCIAKLANDRTGSQVAKVEISLPGGRTAVYRAALVGYEKGQDLAVLRVEAPAEELSPVKIGTSNDLRIGQSVYAIGNPFGLQHTLTVGCVSGLDRTIPSISGDRIFGVIQTDAAISAGNSGGALLDSSGRLVGINTATFTKKGSGRSSGVNFAVPVDIVMATVPRIIVNNSG